MSITNIHHYGLATSDMEASRESFCQLGYDVGGIIIDPIQKVKLCFVKLSSGPLIELVCDLDDQGPTSKLVQKQGSGLYHICFEVEDIEEAINEFRVKKYSLLHKPVAAVAFDGRRIAWMHNRHIGVIELLENANIPS